MFEFFNTLISDLNSDQRFVLVIIALGCGTGIVIAMTGIITGVWHNVRRREAELELTRDLLDQGKTAEEIERILRPSDGFTRAIGSWTSGKPKG